MPLVEPPIAIKARIAFSKELRVRMLFGVASRQTISTMLTPHWTAMRVWPESAAGMEAAPASVRPRISAMPVIVEAVPIVMQVPKERAIPCSISRQSASVILPASFSAQYFQTSEPEPNSLPPQLPRSIGPAGKKTAGIFMLVAPMMRPGVVLSQPPRSTAPSTGWERKSSSVSMARKLR